MALTPEEQQELAAIEQELQARQSPQAPTQGLSPQEQQELAAIEQELQIRQQEAQPGRPVEAFVSGVGQAATLGFLPQLQALGGQVVDALSPGETAETRALEEQGFTITPQERSFVEERDVAIRRQQELEEQNPLASIAGQVVGSLGPGALAGRAAKVGQAATRLGNIGRAGLAGGAFGFAQNPGDIEGEINPLQIRARLENAATGLATGIVTQGALEGAGKIVSKFRELPGTLKERAQLNALKAGGARKRDFLQLFKRNKRDKVADFMLDRNLVQVGDEVSDVAGRTIALKENTGRLIGQISKRIDNTLDAAGPLTSAQRGTLSQGRINAKRIASKARQIIRNEFKDLPQEEEIQRRINQTLDAIARNGDDISLSRARELRRAVDDQITFTKANSELPSVQQAFKKIRGLLSDSMIRKARAVDKVRGTRLASKLEDLNKDFNLLSEIEDFAVKEEAGDAARRFFSLGDRLLGTGGLVVGGAQGEGVEERVQNAMIGLVLGGIGGRLTRQLGPAAFARASNRLSELMTRPANAAKFAQPLIDAARQSPEAVQATIQSLQADPEFIEIINDTRQSLTQRRRNNRGGNNERTSGR